MRLRKKNREQQDNNIKVEELNDDQLITILKKRDYYRPDIVKEVIDTAISRGLIHSKEDLNHLEYKVMPLKRSFFPEIENRETRKRIIKSISRGLLFIGALPIIEGAVRISNSFSAENAIMLAFGLIWIWMVLKMMKKVTLFNLKIIGALAVVSLIFVVNMFVNMAQFSFMDIFIVVIIYALIIYGLLFINKLR